MSPLWICSIATRPCGVAIRVPAIKLAQPSPFFITLISLAKSAALPLYLASLPSD
jgi:hypothetical protein